MTLISISLILFFIMDPLGTINSYLSLVKEIPIKRQRWIIIREMGFALIAMLLFSYIGDYLLYILQVSDISVQLTSGIILFLAAVGIIFPNMRNIRANLPIGQEPFITPLAIPLIAGPSLLATIMLFSHLEAGTYVMPVAILIAWTLSTIILLLAPILHKFLGKNGLLAFERLIGMILVMLAIQRFLEGIHLFMIKASS